MLKEGYTIKWYSKISDYYKIVNGIDCTIDLNSPFQYKNWQTLLYREFIAQKKSGKYIGVILYYKLKPVVGGHFFSKTTGNRTGVFFLGTGGETDYNDLCYFRANVSNEEISMLIEELLLHAKQRVLNISQVQHESPLFLWANNNAIHIKNNTCAKIILKTSFDDYMKSLSKSTRQNIRTAKNRLISDKKEFQIVCFNNQDVSPILADSLLTVYEQRRIIKNKKRTLKQVILEIYRKYLKKRYNILREAIIHLDNKYLAVIYIDNKIAAYLFGLKDCSGLICIMQVAINDEYKRYSPGMLLITKVVEELISAGNIRCLDLTNGDEKYKFDLGAEAHLTEYFTYTRSSKNEES